ncbi:MAG TPA: ABC transporter ATP-binding protein [bacterium]|nr:ABC transporter ATP-binding protein [bacterium]
MNPAVSVKKLTKIFNGFTAVDSVSFETQKGEIYGFLGANGAGKTTVIRILCGLLEPSSGRAIVAGYDAAKEPEKVKQRLGYMPQKSALYGALTVAENMEFYSGLYGMEENRIKQRIHEVSVQTELQNMLNNPVSALPGGIRQRVSLACAIMHEPEIVFLDEPTAGVDPMLRRRFWEIIDGLSEKGTTVFVTTHYMDEVEHCHRAALMNNGRIIKEGPITEIKKSTFKKPVFEVETENITKAYNVLGKYREKIGEISMHGAKLHIIPSAGPAAAVRIIRSILKKHGVSAGKITGAEPTMEDVFVKVVREG